MRRYIYEFLKKSHLLKIFYKFTKVGKLESEINVYHRDDGYFAIPAHNLDLLESFIYFNKNHVDLDLLKNFLEFSDKIPNRTFLDLGANIGEYSIGLQKYFTKIVAVEGNPTLVKCLRISSVLNKTNMEILGKWIVPDVNKTWNVNFTPNLLTTYLTEGSHSLNQDYNYCTLGDLIDVYSPNVVKMDLEGLDIKLLLETHHSAFKKIEYLIFECKVSEFFDSEIENYLAKTNLRISAITRLRGNEVMKKQDITLCTSDELLNFHFKR